MRLNNSSNNFYWYVNSKSNHSHPNNSNYSFSSDLPGEIEFNQDNRWAVSLVLISIPARFINVDETVWVKLNKFNHSLKYVISLKSYPNLKTLVAEINKGIKELGMYA